MEAKHEYFQHARPHPGETLTEKLEEMNMGPKEFALRTGKPEKTIIAVMNGKSAITPDMAVQFEQVTLIPANFWMNHQRGYDEFIARVKRKKAITGAIPWAKKFPLAEMIRKGWLPSTTKMEEKTTELLNFFSFSNHTGWEDYYFKQQLKVAFRISLKKTVDPYAISAWLRKGELQAKELQSEPFSLNDFKAALPELQQIMRKQRKDYFSQVQKICLSIGVKVVITPGINKVPISGSTRWIKDTPLIQLSDKFKNTDAFWFTFFHEIGHILLHGKKDIFLEKVEYSDKQQNQEEEADAFALNYVV
jgi:addiction module HigA family antidote